MIKNVLTVQIMKLGLELNNAIDSKKHQKKVATIDRHFEN